MRTSEYLSAAELRDLGLAAVGRHVFISRDATISHPERVHLGDRVRIDAFSVLIARAPIRVGSNVHIGSLVTINASAEVEIGNFAGISSGTKIFTTDDDYGGDYLTGPTIEPEYTNITMLPVRLGEHCIVGANSVILPGASLGEGAAVGALSLIKGELPEWGIYGGVPAQFLKPRSKELLSKAAAMIASEAAGTSA